MSLARTGARLAFALPLFVAIFLAHGPRPSADEFRFNSNAFRYYCQAVALPRLADARAATARAVDETAAGGYGVEADHMTAVVDAMDRLSVALVAGDRGRAVDDLRKAQAWFPTCTTTRPKPRGSI